MAMSHVPLGEMTRYNIRLPEFTRECKPGTPSATAQRVYTLTDTTYTRAGTGTRSDVRYRLGDSPSARDGQQGQTKP
eukprot:1172818-Prorocentrum_minimum.AAC.4